MQKVHYSIFIDAPREKVWETMLADETYRQWTMPFSAGSYYEGDWSEGSKMLFLGPSEDGSDEMGMVSRIAENRKPEFLSIEHLGLYTNGGEDIESEEARKWMHSHENYTFKESNGGTELQIDVEVDDEYVSMFNTSWPQALAVLKEVCEKP